MTKLLLAFFTLSLAACNGIAYNKEVSAKTAAPDSLAAVDSSSMGTEAYDAYITFEGAEGTVPNSVPEYTVEAKDPALPSLTTAEDNACTPYPATIAELNSGTDMFIYKFNRELQASAKVMGYGAELGKKDILFVQDYVRYSDCSAEKRVGIGLRCFIHVKDIKGRLSFDKLNQVAASVQAGKCTASFALKSLGFAIDGSVLVDGLQSQGEYNIESAGKLTQVYNNVLKLLNASNPMPVRPVVLVKE